MRHANKVAIAAAALCSGLIVVAVPLAFATGTVIQSRICLPFGTPTITDPAQDATDGDASIVVSGAADPAVTVEVTDNGAGSGVTGTDSTGAYSISIPLAYGPNVLQAHVTNACNTVNSSNTVTITHPAPAIPPTQGGTAVPGTTPGVSSLQPVILPPTPITAPLPPEASSVPTRSYSTPVVLVPQSGVVVTKSGLTITGRADPGAVVQIVDDGHIVAQVVTGINGLFSTSIPLHEGINSITAQLTLTTGVIRSKVIIVDYVPPAHAAHGIIARIALAGGVLAVISGIGIAIYAVIARMIVAAKHRKRE